MRGGAAPAILALIMTVAAAAGAGAADRTESLIGSGVFAGAQGVVAVIAGSGDDNLVFNGAAVSTAGSQDFSAAAASVVAHQHLDTPAAEGPGFNIAVIGPEAFAGTRGLIMVANVSGNGNLAGNLAAIAHGGGVQVADAVLSQTRSGGGAPADGYADFAGYSQIDDTAFRDAAGIAQVINAAGSGHTLGNTFTLSVAADMGR